MISFLLLISKILKIIFVYSFKNIIGFSHIKKNIFLLLQGGFLLPGSGPRRLKWSRIPDPYHCFPVRCADHPVVVVDYPALRGLDPADLLGNWNSIIRRFPLEFRTLSLTTGRRQYMGVQNSLQFDILPHPHFLRFWISFPKFQSPSPLDVNP